MLSRILAAFSVILYFFHYNCYLNRIQDSQFTSLSYILIFVKTTSLILSVSRHSPQNLQRINFLNVLFNFVWPCVRSWYTFDLHCKVEHRGFLFTHLTLMIPLIFPIQNTVLNNVHLCRYTEVIYRQ